MNGQTAAKAWAGAASGVFIALITLVSSYFATGTVEPAALSGLGSAVGIFAEALIMAAVGYATVYFSPRNKDIEE